MKNKIHRIIEFLDSYLKSSGKVFITPPEANKLLEEAGILNDSKSREGQPLRKLLRAGDLPHAYKIGRDWFIPHSCTLPTLELNNKTTQIPDTHTLGDYKESFAPLIDADSKFLILGTLPGEKSLKTQEYYADSRNRFWKVIFKINNSHKELSYAEKKELLLKNKIALWDVYSSANRKGSLDVNIKSGALYDIDSLLNDYPSIEKVIFNGRDAEEVFNKNFKHRDNIEYYYMPSTSSSNGKCSIDQIASILGKLIID